MKEQDEEEVKEEDEVKEEVVGKRVKREELDEDDIFKKAPEGGPRIEKPEIEIIEEKSAERLDENEKRNEAIKELSEQIQISNVKNDAAKEGSSLNRLTSPLPPKNNR